MSLCVISVFSAPLRFTCFLTAEAQWTQRLRREIPIKTLPVLPCRGPVFRLSFFSPTQLKSRPKVEKEVSMRVITRTLFVPVILLLTMVIGSAAVKAQVAPRPKPAETKKPEPTTTPRVNKVRIPRVRSGSPEDSYNFLLLGDRFYEKGRWNAAAAAYKESIRLWSGSQANAALKELHEATRVK